ncbi:MAG: hypothetical protein ACI8S6_003629 [Myxococcota bacterium]|jgi:hypothetical protein
MLAMWLLWGCAQAPRFIDPAEDLMARLDVDRSGSLSATELRGFEAARVMPIIDRDRDEQVDLEELQLMMSKVGGQRSAKGKGKAKGKTKTKAGGRPPPQLVPRDGG